MKNYKRSRAGLHAYTHCVITSALRLTCIILITCGSFHARSQSITAKASIDKDAILIGEPISLQLEVRLPMGTDANWFSLDTIPHFEFIEKAKIDTSKDIEGKLYKQTISITSFDSGRWVIPSFALNVNGTSYITDSLPVTVAYSDFDTSKEYHDIKDILEVENPNTKFINLVLAALTILSLLGLVYFLRKRHGNVREPETVPKSRLSSLEEAMRALEELNSQQLPRQGQVKLHYTRLNDILRSYVSVELASGSMQKTNEELIFSIKQSGIPNENLISLMQTLRMTDAVKFAKFSPDHHYNEENMQTIRNAIQTLNKLPRT